MEATSIYGNALARFLFAAGYKVSIVNPSRPKAFGRSELSRTKTDRADAKVIARFCAALCPAPWTPPCILRESKGKIFDQAIKQGKIRAAPRDTKPDL